MQRQPLAFPDDAAPPRLPILSRAVVALKARPFEARRGDLLTTAGSPVVGAYLVSDGMVAVLPRGARGGGGEAGLVGPGRLLGYAAAFGASLSTSDAEALTTVRGHVVEPDALVRLMASHANFAREISDYALWRIAELERLLACASSHSVEQRLARWLAGAAAIKAGRPIEVTHHQLARLFGVRRASVTVSLHVLEGEQAVRCRRGLVEIRDFARLEAASCGCHRPLQARPPAERAQDASRT